MQRHIWNSVPEEVLMPGLTRRAIHSAGLTVARFRLAKGVTIPEHRHPNEQATTVERGALKFHVDGREVVVGAGETLLLAVGEPHAVEALEDTECLDVFTPARTDWITGDDAYLRR
jgi:quercetin dioxygenase-like cupin family protein